MKTTHKLFRGRALLTLLTFSSASLLFSESSSSAASVTFDLDNGMPALTTGQGTPFDQSVDGLTAHFSSALEPAFSIQNAGSTQFKLSQFSGNYLNPNSVNRNVLKIRFSQPITQIALVFATVDYHDNAEVPANLQVTAYLGTATAAVGSAMAHGSYTGDSYPQSTLSLDTAGQPFDRVEVVVPPQATGTTTFLIDNVTVLTSDLPQLGMARKDNQTIVLSWPAAASDFVLQESSTCEPSGWLDSTNGVDTVGDRNEVVLAISAAQRYYRLVRP